MISAGSSSMINGLILAGGKSRRMGTDKSNIQWHGRAQRYYMADVLQQLCADVFISCREEQAAEMDDQYKIITDAYSNAGPLGGILSAFKHQPAAAWLVVACDLPLLDNQTLQYLITNRNSDKIATTFKSPHDGLPEPLITIWEPKALPILLSFHEKNITCPRKVLLNSDVKIITPPDADALLNANTPEDADKVRQMTQAQNITV